MKNFKNQVEEIYKRSMDFYFKTVECLLRTKLTDMNIVFNESNILNDLSINEGEGENKFDVLYGDIKICTLSHITTSDLTTGILLEIKEV